jgi:hypothetical protein
MVLCLQPLDHLAVSIPCNTSAAAMHTTISHIISSAHWADLQLLHHLAISVHLQ